MTVCSPQIHAQTLITWLWVDLSVLASICLEILVSCLQACPKVLNIKAALPQGKSWEREDKPPKVEALCFHYPLSEASSHHLCCFLFSRSKSLIAATFKERYHTRAGRPREWVNHWGQSRGGLLPYSWQFLESIEQYWNTCEKSSFAIPNWFSLFFAS